jgi:HEPN domain-containing protein
VDTKSIIEYWVTSSEENYKTARALYLSRRYAHSLFFCHLTIENILKALVVQKISEQAPYEHNLSLLSGLAGINFSKPQLDLMDEINSFNIKGRYDDYKFKFYKKATIDYAEKYLDETTDL